MSDSPETPHDPAPKTEARPRRRWLKRAAIALACVVGIAIALLCVVASCLDRPFVKQRIARLVKGELGIAIDYQRTLFRPFSGLAVDGLEVASPSEFVKTAPELLRIGSVQISWSLGSIFGPRAPIKSVKVQDVALAVVRRGAESSLSALLAARPKKSATSSPAPSLSQTIAALPPELPVGRIEVAGVTLTLDAEGPTVPGAPPALDRFRLSGIELDARASGEGSARRLTIAIGAPGAPEPLKLVRDGQGEADARLGLLVSIERGQLTGKIDLALDSQTLDSSWPKLHELFALDVSARAPAGARRVEVDVRRLQAADEAFSAHASIVIPDEGAPMVESAAGAVDLARLAALLPESVTGIALAKGGLRFEAEQLSLAGGGSLHLHGALDGVRLKREGQALALDDAVLGLDADAGANRKLGGTLTLRFGRLSGSQEGQSLAASGGQLALELADVVLDPARLLASTGTARLRGSLKMLAVHAGGVETRGQSVGLSLATRLDGRPPYRLDAEIPIAALDARRDRGAKLLDRAPGKVILQVTGLYPDAARPVASRARVHATVDLGGIALTLDSDKRADEADFQLAAEARHLGLLSALLGTGARSVPWSRIGLTLASKGTVRRIVSRAPVLSQSSTVVLTHPALEGRASLDRLALALDSEGDATVEKAHLALDFQGLKTGGVPRGDGKLAGTVSFDLSRPAASVSLRGSGSAGPAGGIAISGSWDRRTRAVRYRADVDLSQLALVESFVPPEVRQHHRVSWSQLALGLHASGEVSGAVMGFRSGARPILARDPLRAARGTDQVDLSLSGLRYRGDGGLHVRVPSLVAHTQVSSDGKRLALSSKVTIPEVHAAAGSEKLDAEGLAPDFDLALTGDPRAGEGELTVNVTAQKIHDSAIDFYPLGGVALALHLTRSAEGDVRISALRFDNRQGGTHLTASGGLDLTADGGAPPERELSKHGSELSKHGKPSLGERLIAGRRSLSVSGTIEQNLGALAGGARQISASGKLALAFQVRSGDLRLYHTTGTLSLSDARLTLAGAHVEVSGVNARLPVAQDLLVADDGTVSRLGGVDVNAYPRLRFADQHPFLSEESFLKIEKVQSGTLEIGPLAGNARVDRNLVALDQLELLAGGGKITGQCLVDLSPDDTRVTFRGAVSGLRPKGGDPGERLDANAALTLGLAERSLEGRIDLIRIGRHHLLDLLDLYDPYHADVGANRVRLALKVGYPKSVRIALEHGFASLQITLGGIARLVRIDQIRGIPTGPIVEKYLGPFLPKGAP